MAMFDDPKKELQKLEEQLLKDEEWLDRELAAARALIGDAPVKKTKKPAAAKKPAAQTAKKEGESVRGSAEVQKKAAKVVVPPTNDYDLDEKKPKKKKQSKPQKSNRGLVILAVLETLGIVGVVAYWLVMIL